MSKLFKSNKSLRLDEAVLYLSKVFNKPVSIADLYRFALEDRLTLSVDFVNGACGLQGKWIKADDIANKSAYQMSLVYGAPGVSEKSPKPNEMFVSGDDWISWEDDIEPISGLWDLTMKGVETFDIKDSYHKLTSGISVKHIYTNGLLLQQGNVVCQLYKLLSDDQSARDIYNKIFPPQEIVISDTGELIKKKYRGTLDVKGIDIIYYSFFNKIKNSMGMYFVPCRSLDEHDFMLVIRTKEFTRFIQSLEGTQQEAKPLTPPERNSYLVLITALCKKINVNPKERGLAKDWVEKTQLRNTPLCQNTILNVLKQIEPITCSKGKSLAAAMLTTHGRNTFLVLIDLLCQEAKVDYEHKNIVESLVDMTKSNGTPLTEDIINEILSQIEDAICSRSI